MKPCGRDVVAAYIYIYDVTQMSRQRKPDMLDNYYKWLDSLYTWEKSNYS